MTSNTTYAHIYETRYSAVQSCSGIKTSASYLNIMHNTWASSKISFDTVTVNKNGIYFSGFLQNTPTCFVIMDIEQRKLKLHQNGSSATLSWVDPTIPKISPQNLLKISVDNFSYFMEANLIIRQIIFADKFIL